MAVAPGVCAADGAVPAFAVSFVAVARPEAVSAFVVLPAFCAAPASWLPFRDVTICARALVCAPIAILEAAVPLEPGVESMALLATMTVATGVGALVAASADELAAVCVASVAALSD